MPDPRGPRSQPCIWAAPRPHQATRGYPSTPPASLFTPPVTPKFGRVVSDLDLSCDSELLPPAHSVISGATSDINEVLPPWAASTPDGQFCLPIDTPSDVSHAALDPFLDWDFTVDLPPSFKAKPRWANSAPASPSLEDPEGAVKEHPSHLAAAWASFQREPAGVHKPRSPSSLVTAVSGQHTPPLEDASFLGSAGDDNGCKTQLLAEKARELLRTYLASTNCNDKCSVSCARFQVLLQKKLPDLFEDVVNTAFDRKFHLFVQKACGLHSFIYSSDDLKDLTHIGANDRRVAFVPELVAFQADFAMVPMFQALVTNIRDRLKDLVDNPGMNHRNALADRLVLEYPVYAALPKTALRESCREFLSKARKQKKAAAVAEAS